MDTGSNGIKRNNREPGQQAFDKGFSPAALRWVGGAMDPMQQLRCVIAEIAKSSSAQPASWDSRLPRSGSQAIRTLESIRIPMVIAGPPAFVALTSLPHPSNQDLALAGSGVMSENQRR
jgi:hypothetical protein